MTFLPPAHQAGPLRATTTCSCLALNRRLGRLSKLSLTPRRGKRGTVHSSQWIRYGWYQCLASCGRLWSIWNPPCGCHGCGGDFYFDLLLKAPAPAATVTAPSSSADLGRVPTASHPGDSGTYRRCLCLAITHRLAPTTPLPLARHAARQALANVRPLPERWSANKIPLPLYVSISQPSPNP